MDDLTLHYYDAEMRYLREAVKELAQAHPNSAAMLDLDKTGTPDPFVARQVDGVACAMGLRREKIDDALLAQAEGLASMPRPRALCIIPSLTRTCRARSRWDLKKRSAATQRRSRTGRLSLLRTNNASK